MQPPRGSTSSAREPVWQMKNAAPTQTATMRIIASRRRAVALREHASPNRSCAPGSSGRSADAMATPTATPAPQPPRESTSSAREPVWQMRNAAPTQTATMRITASQRRAVTPREHASRGRKSAPASSDRSADAMGTPTATPVRQPQQA